MFEVDVKNVMEGMGGGPAWVWDFDVVVTEII